MTDEHNFKFIQNRHNRIRNYSKKIQNTSDSLTKKTHFTINTEQTAHDIKINKQKNTNDPKSNIPKTPLIANSADANHRFPTPNGKSKPHPEKRAKTQKAQTRPALYI